MRTQSPCIQAHVNKPNVDVIHVSSEKDAGWKLDGFKGDELVEPDELQDHFECIVYTLAKYVDETSVWIIAESGREISAWEAMTLLTEFDDEDDA